MSAVTSVIEQHRLGTLDSYTFTTHNSGNDVFVGSKYVVKLFTKRKGDGSLKERRLCEALRQTVPTPEVIAAGKTKTGDPYLIMRRMPGSTLQLLWSELPDDDKRQYSGAMGKTLALIHNAATEADGILMRPALPLKHRLHERAKESLDIVARKKLLSPKTIDILRSYCETQLTHAQQGEQVLLHGGFRTGNLIVSQGRIVGIIDWEDAELGDAAEELALVMYRTVPQEFHDTFLASYQMLRPLPPTLGTLSHLYPLLYYLRFLPDIATWTQFPAKQAYYTKETEKIIKEITGHEERIHTI